MNCRGEKTREQIVRDYEVTPIIHAKLLNGQIKTSDASALITDQYYIFECVHKGTQKKELIQCGMGAANHLLKLTKHESLPIFNVLKGKKEGSTVSKRDDGTPGAKGRKSDPAAKELFNAIMILIVDWSAKPNTPLFDIKKEAEKYMYCTPFPARIERVNNIIAKDSKQRTITEILLDWKRAGNDIREYKFDLLNEILAQNGIDSNF